MSNTTKPSLPTQGSADKAVDDFIRKLQTAPVIKPAGKRGRLLFALDATMSREPTWDAACKIQGDMFAEAGKVGGLSIQLVYFRGLGELHASRWVNEPAVLAQQMTGVDCRGGLTQLVKVMKHGLEETGREKIDAIVYVGDCFEESGDAACDLAGKIALHGTPMFLFHEGGERGAARVFKELARITRGAYCPFDAGSAKQLAELLKAVAIYAAGGRRALEDHAKRAGGGALLIAHQVNS